MKQRLSIAIALLHEPELLILDEPTNGLDPNGIIEIRELIRKLNKEFKTTILVSSHILGEMEKMATHVGIIHHGKLLFQGTMSELQLMKKGNTFIEVETNNNLKAMEILRSNYSAELLEGKIVLPLSNKEECAVLTRLLVQSGFDVYAIHPQQSNLEQLFLDITSANHE